MCIEKYMKQLDDNIGYVLKKLEDTGQLDSTIVVFATDNGAETTTFADGGSTPFKVQTGEAAWEGGYRAPLVIRWPGKPGTIHDQLCTRLVAHAGRHALKKEIEAGKYAGIVKTR